MRKLTPIAIVMLLAAVFGLRPTPSQAGTMPVITVTATPSSQLVYQQTVTIQVKVTDLTGNPLSGTVTLYLPTNSNGSTFGPFLGFSPAEPLDANGQFVYTAENLCASGFVFYGFNYDNPPAGYNAVDTYSVGMTPVPGMPASVTVPCGGANTVTQLSCYPKVPVGIDMECSVQVIPVAPSSNTLGQGHCVPYPNGAGVSMSVDGVYYSNLGLICSSTDLSGYGTFDYVFTTVGTHTITATFNGTPTYNPSTTTATITVYHPSH